MNSQNCPCSTAWWLKDSQSSRHQKALQHESVQGFCEIPTDSAGHGSFPLHIQASLTCIADQVVDAIHAKGGLARQQSIPVLGREVGLQPEDSMHAGGIHLHEAFVEARSDEIQLFAEAGSITP